MKWDFDKLMIGQAGDGTWFLTLVKGNFPTFIECQAQAEKYHEYLIAHAHDVDDQLETLWDSLLFDIQLDIQREKEKKT